MIYSNKIFLITTLLLSNALIARTQSLNSTAEESAVIRSSVAPTPVVSSAEPEPSSSRTSSSTRSTASASSQERPTSIITTRLPSSSSAASPTTSTRSPIAPVTSSPVDDSSVGSNSDPFKDGQFPFNAGGIAALVVIIVVAVMGIIGCAFYRRNRRRRIMNERRLNELYNFGSNSSVNSTTAMRPGAPSFQSSPPSMPRQNSLGSVPGSSGLPAPPVPLTISPAKRMQQQYQPYRGFVDNSALYVGNAAGYNQLEEGSNMGDMRMPAQDEYYLPEPAPVQSTDNWYNGNY